MSDLICRSCGAKIEYAAEEKSLKCLYCGTVNEIQCPEDALPDAVDAIIPMGMSVEALERSAQAYMAQGDFTPYDQLTEAQVLGWCWDNGVDKASVEASVEQQIVAQANAPVVALPLPWSPVVAVDEPVIVSEAPIA